MNLDDLDDYFPVYVKQIKAGCRWNVFCIVWMMIMNVGSLFSFPSTVTWEFWVWLDEFWLIVSLGLLTPWLMYLAMAIDGFLGSRPSLIKQARRFRNIAVLSPRFAGEIPHCLLLKEFQMTCLWHVFAKSPNFIDKADIFVNNYSLVV